MTTRSRPLGHGAAGAEWLRQRGYAELAPAVASHPVMELGTAPTLSRRGRGRRDSAGPVVTYADKRARQDLLTPRPTASRAGTTTTQTAARLDEADVRARRLETRDLRLAGITPEDVARLPWVNESDACRGLTSPISGARTRGQSSAPARDFRAALEQQAGQPYDVWRTSGDEDDASAEVAAGKRRDRVIDGSPSTSRSRPCSPPARSSSCASRARCCARRPLANGVSEILAPRSLRATRSSSSSCSRPVAVARRSRACCATRSRPPVARSRTSLPSRAIAWRAGSRNARTELGITLAPGRESTACRARRRVRPRRRRRPAADERAGQRASSRSSRSTGPMAPSRARTSTRSSPRPYPALPGRSSTRSAAAVRRRRRRSPAGSSRKAPRSRS